MEPVLFYFRHIFQTRFFSANTSLSAFIFLPGIIHFPLHILTTPERNWHDSVPDIGGNT